MPNVLPRSHSQNTGGNKMIFRQGSASSEDVLPGGGDVATGQPRPGDQQPPPGAPGLLLPFPGEQGLTKRPVGSQGSQPGAGGRLWGPNRPLTALTHLPSFSWPVKYERPKSLFFHFLQMRKPGDLGGSLKSHLVLHKGSHLNQRSAK